MQMIRFAGIVLVLSLAGLQPHPIAPASQEIERLMFPRGIPLRDNVLGGKIQPVFRLGPQVSFGGGSELVVCFEDVRTAREIANYSVVHVVHLQREGARPARLVSSIDVTDVLAAASAYGPVLYEVNAAASRIDPSLLPSTAHIRVIGRGWGRALGEYASELLVQVQTDGRLVRLIDVPGTYRYSREAPESGRIVRFALRWAADGTRDILKVPVPDPQFPKVQDRASRFEFREGRFGPSVEVDPRLLRIGESVSAMGPVR